MTMNHMNGVHRVPLAKPVCTEIPADHYNGAELRPYDGRPGANDALRLPSRIGATLHYRDGRTAPV
jgi:hypothetical protein